MTLVEKTQVLGASGCVTAELAQEKCAFKTLVEGMVERTLMIFLTHPQPEGRQNSTAEP